MERAQSALALRDAVVLPGGLRRCPPHYSVASSASGPPQRARRQQGLEALPASLRRGIGERLSAQEQCSTEGEGAVSALACGRAAR